MSLAETISTGINNPECAFFVGNWFGQASTGSLIVFLGLVYFGFKFADKLIFIGVPKLYKKIRTRKVKRK